MPDSAFAGVIERASQMMCQYVRLSKQIEVAARHAAAREGPAHGSAPPERRLAHARSQLVTPEERNRQLGGLELLLRVRDEDRAP
jgi:hypothetical protein